MVTGHGFRFALCAEVVFDSRDSCLQEPREFQFALCAEVVFDLQPAYFSVQGLGFNSLFALRWSSTHR